MEAEGGHLSFSDPYIVPVSKQQLTALNSHSLGKKVNGGVSLPRFDMDILY